MVLKMNDPIYINNGLPIDIWPQRPVSLKPASCAGVVYNGLVYNTQVHLLFHHPWDDITTRPVRDDRIFYMLLL